MSYDNYQYSIVINGFNACQVLGNGFSEFMLVSYGFQRHFLISIFNIYIFFLFNQVITLANFKNYFQKKVLKYILPR